MDGLDNFLVVSADPRGSQQRLLTRINAHVARHSHRRRRHEWSKVQDAPKEISIKPRPQPSTSQWALVSKGGASAHPSFSTSDKLKRRKLKRSATSGDESSSGSDNVPSAQEHMSRTGVKVSLLPRNDINRGSLDPFMRLPVELSDRDKGLLQFCEKPREIKDF